MKAYAIAWNDEPSQYAIYLHRKDAEQHLKDILEGKTYDRTPSVVEIEIKEQYKK